jgi:hypothetical protein
MTSREPKISKQQATATTRHITFTIPQTLETNRNPGHETSHSVTVAPYRIGLLTVFGIKNKQI